MSLSEQELRMVVTRTKIVWDRMAREYATNGGARTVRNGSKADTSSVPAKPRRGGASAQCGRRPKGKARQKDTPGSRPRGGAAMSAMGEADVRAQAILLIRPFYWREARSRWPGCPVLGAVGEPHRSV